MNQTLKDAVREVEALPAVRKRIDAKLAAAEARGGATPHEEFRRDLKRIFSDES
jgi:hypothetical protein